MQLQLNNLINDLIEFCKPPEKTNIGGNITVNDDEYIYLVNSIAQLTMGDFSTWSYLDYIQPAERDIDYNADNVEYLDFETTVATLVCVHRELHWDNFSNVIEKRVLNGKLYRLASHLLEAKHHGLNYVLDGVMGFVVGDALGVPVEFCDRTELKKNPVTDMREYGSHQQPAGTWSDDSSLVFCTMESLKQGIDYENIMEHFKAWWGKAEYTPYNEVFDIGVATNKAITKFEKGVDPLLCGGTEEYDNGNGSLMRILPIALYQYAHCQHMMTCNQPALMIPIHNASKLTHAHKISLMACGIYSKIVGFTLVNRNRLELFNCIEDGLKDAFNYYGYSNETEYRHVINKFSRLMDLVAFKNLEEQEIRSSGFVVDTLEAAIWCLLNTASYKDCILKAVNLGDDTDTVAAVAGGIAGLYYGYKNIPKEWVDKIARRRWIEEMCNCFYKSLMDYEINKR